MLPFAELRAEAETLSEGLPTIEMLAGYRTTAQSGAASRQRSGTGEDFWQYRGQTPDDSAASIDWRRSATGDELYIREHELQSARLLSIWADGSKSFDWKSDRAPLTKADAARAARSRPAEEPRRSRHVSAQQIRARNNPPSSASANPSPTTRHPPSKHLQIRP